MSFRVTNMSLSDQLNSEIALQEQRLSVAQQQVSTGLAINSPSDNPFGDAAVINISTQQAVMTQFGQNASTVNMNLEVADGALDQYQQNLDSASALLTEGMTSTTDQTGKDGIATQLQGMIQTVLGIANMQNNGQYVFGGTSQTAPPFDPTTQALSATPTSPQMVQVQPGTAPIAAGVSADSVFSNSNGTVLAALTSAVTALQGTGNPTADQATLTAAAQQLSAFSDQANAARTTLGTNMQLAQAASTLTSAQSTSLQTQASNIQSADFATASTNLASASTALQAVVESAASMNGKTLLDLLA